ncbi:MAG: hypothetical protein IJQ16_03875, partial [Selenomonadaceae bacterium]|nr:hypothetical protein [Selenomonadaceae bacterium]
NAGNDKKKSEDNAGKKKSLNKNDNSAAQETALTKAENTAPAKKNDKSGSKVIYAEFYAEETVNKG